MPSEPSPRQTLAVLLGASSFRRAPSLAQGRAFYKSAEDFRDYLMSAEGLGLPCENVNWLFDDSRSPSDQLQDIGSFLEHRSTELKNGGTPAQDLIVYYVGHGLFSESDQAYCLAIRGLDERSKGLTSIRGSDLASIIKAQARFLRKFLILDCCFSAAAYKEFQSGPLQATRVKLLDEFPQKGTTLLCSSSAQDVSIAPEGLDHTMFSDSLLKSLRQGCPSLGARLSLSEVGDLVKVNLREAYPHAWVRPEVQSPDQREGDVASIPLFPNVAYAVQKAETERAREEARTKAEADRVAHEKAEEQRVARETAEAARKKRVALEESKRKKAAAEKAATELAERKRAEEELALKEAERRRIAAETAESKRVATEKAADAQKELTTKEQAERERLAEIAQAREPSSTLFGTPPQQMAVRSIPWKMLGAMAVCVLVIIIGIWYWNKNPKVPQSTAEPQAGNAPKGSEVVQPSSPGAGEGAAVHPLGQESNASQTPSDSSKKAALLPPVDTLKGANVSQGSVELRNPVLERATG